MSAVRQILDAIHSLPQGEQRHILQELAQELGWVDNAQPMAANDAAGSDETMLEEREGILVYTGPVDAAAMDHRLMREERATHLSSNARRV